NDLVLRSLDDWRGFAISRAILPVRFPLEITTNSLSVRGIYRKLAVSRKPSTSRRCGYGSRFKTTRTMRDFLLSLFSGPRSTCSRSSQAQRRRAVGGGASARRAAQSERERYGADRAFDRAGPVGFCDGGGHGQPLDAAMIWPAT